MDSSGLYIAYYYHSKDRRQIAVLFEPQSGYRYYKRNSSKWDKTHLISLGFHGSENDPRLLRGHIIISDKYPAGRIDKDINKMLKKATVGKIRGLDPRSNLLNANVSGRLNINYSLIEMGFLTNKKDTDYLKKNYDAFSKELAGAINGKPIGGDSAEKTPTKPRAVKPNAKQTVWNWKGRFTANTTIKVRKPPGLKGKGVDSDS